MLDNVRVLQIDLFTPLTAAELAERDRLDEELDKHEESTVKYFQALKDYRDKLLWRGHYPTFVAYLQSRRKRYAKTRQRLGQLVNFDQILIALTSVVDENGKPLVAVLPDKERQTRELLALSDPTEIAAAWLNAQVAAGEDQPSYSWVRSSVETIEESKNTVGTLVDTGEGGVPLAVGAAEATANKENERLQRMRDHIKANQKSKPLIVFESAPQAMFNGTWLSMNIPAEVADKLRVGVAVRFVVYEVQKPTIPYQGVKE